MILYKHHDTIQYGEPDDDYGCRMIINNGYHSVWVYSKWYNLAWKYSNQSRRTYDEIKQHMERKALAILLRYVNAYFMRNRFSCGGFRFKILQTPYI